MKIDKWQRSLLYVFFFSLNFEVWDPLHTNGNFSISKLTGFLYFISILPSIESFLKISFQKQYLRPILIFLTLLVVMSVINMNYLSSSFIDLTIVQNILLFIILINHERKQRGILKKGMFAFSLGSIALSVFYELGIGISYEGGRVSIFGDNENNIGIRMCISLVILFLIIMRYYFNFGKLRFVLLAALPSMIALMFDTGSRVAFISFALMFICSTFLIKTKRSYYKALIIIGGVTTFFFIWLSLANSSTELMNRLQRSEQNGDLGGREGIWDVIVPFIMEHPLFGSGMTGYELYITKIKGSLISPHNVILEVISYTGFVGLYFYLLFAYRTFKCAYRRYRNDGFFLSLVLYIPISGLILSGQLLHAKIGWIIFAFGASNVFYLRSVKTSGSENKEGYTKF